MSNIYSTFAEVSEHYGGIVEPRADRQARSKRLSTTARVLESLIGDVPEVSVDGGLTGIAIEQIMEELEREGIPKRSRDAVMSDIRVIGFDVGLRLYLVPGGEGTIGYGIP
tara:strand:+ start:6868 stop:7200 length:333 start_codon:yes stop_codon:yes gene_type:complete